MPARAEAWPPMSGACRRGQRLCFPRLRGSALRFMQRSVIFLERTGNEAASVGARLVAASGAGGAVESAGGAAAVAGTAGAAGSLNATRRLCSRR